MKHTIVVETPDYIQVSPEEMEEAITGALLGTEVVYAREIHHPVKIVSYHREDVTAIDEAPAPQYPIHDVDDTSHAKPNSDWER